MLSLNWLNVKGCSARESEGDGIVGILSQRSAFVANTGNKPKCKCHCGAARSKRIHILVSVTFWWAADVASSQQSSSDPKEPQCSSHHSASLASGAVALRDLDSTPRLKNQARFIKSPLCAILEKVARREKERPRSSRMIVARFKCCTKPRNISVKRSNIDSSIKADGPLVTTHLQFSGISKRLGRAKQIVINV